MNKKITPRPSINVVREEMNEIRRIQAESIDALDSKAGILLGFTGAILALSIGSLDIELKWKLIFGLLHIISMIVSLVFLFFALNIKSFRFDPSPDTLLKDYMFRKEDISKEQYGSKEQILADQVNAYKINENILSNKASDIKYSLYFLLVGLILLVFHKFI